MTTCKKCNAGKNETEFAIDKNRKSGRYVYCKTCVRKISQQWYSNNKCREASKRRARRGPPRKNGRYSLGGKSDAQRVREYRQRHPDRARESSAQWHAQSKVRFPRWASRVAMREIYARARALRQAGHDIHVDHVVPLRSKLVSGLHCEDNLTIISKTNNLRKSNRYWPGMP